MPSVDAESNASPLNRAGLLIIQTQRFRNIYGSAGDGLAVFAGFLMARSGSNIWVDSG